MYSTERMLARFNKYARVVAPAQPLLLTVNYYSSEAG